jgi:hypothetical protein
MYVTKFDLLISLFRWKAGIAAKNRNTVIFGDSQEKSNRLLWHFPKR